MAETHVLSALKRQYARTLGALHVAHGDRVRIMGDLTHLAAVIRMFSPTENIEAIRPVRPYRLNRARWKRVMIAVLREADRPLGGRELARLVLSRCRLDPSDTRLRLSIEASLIPVLTRMADEGDVKITGKPRRWAIARD